MYRTNRLLIYIPNHNYKIKTLIIIDNKANNDITYVFIIIERFKKKCIKANYLNAQ